MRPLRSLSGGNHRPVDAPSALSCSLHSSSHILETSLRVLRPQAALTLRLRFASGACCGCHLAACSNRMRPVARLLALFVALLAWSFSLQPSASPPLTSLFGDGRTPRVLLLTAHPDDEARLAPCFLICRSDPRDRPCSLLPRSCTCNGSVSKSQLSASQRVGLSVHKCERMPTRSCRQCDRPGPPSGRGAVRELRRPGRQQAARPAHRS
jgi:hypothetical protein